MMWLKRTLFCFSFALASVAQAQFTYAPDQGIPVEYNNLILAMPWAGAFNSPQFNTMDLNGDMVEDLVIFDRTANSIITFLNQNKAYHYAPEYEAFFPADLDQWVLLRDFNCDGKKDIFTSDPFGMKAFVNITAPGGNPKWREFNPGFPILTIGFNGNINLQVNGTDIPAIDDVDGDGDLDVLDARFVGIGSLEWHKNMSIENTGKCDSLQLKRITQTWGNFEECNCGEYIFGPGTCVQFGGRVEHAAGKSILTIDLDNDGDRDLLFTEETCTNLYVLPNDGTKDNAVMTGFTEFPSASNPLDLQIFPAPYYEDVDFDGLPDLIVAANVYTRNSFSINFSQSAWLYKNTGTLQLPSFTFIKNNFLQDQMVDVGDNAVPAFFDADGDGDVDLFIGNYLGINAPSGIYYFENTGTSGAPSFKLITQDYAGISLSGWYNLKPQFADMNGDGKTDLVFTATSLQTNITTLQFIPNGSSAILDVTAQPVVPTGFIINQPENLLVVDVNQDGRKDLLLGKSTGALEYWINNGPAGSFNFSVADASFLGLGVSTDRQSIALAAADLDADGRDDLITGDQRGVLTLYGDYRAQNLSVHGVQNILYNGLTDSYYPTHLGGHVWPSVANLFNSNKPTIIVGNTLGGIHVLKNDDSRELPPDPVIDIYPNPVLRGKEFTIKADRNVLVGFFTILGQKISDDLFIPANQPYPITPQGLSSGMYVARFSVSGKTYNKRFVIY
jgi:hypothetical protein